MVPWLGCFQRAGLLLKLHWLPGQAPPHPLRTDQKNDGQGEGSSEQRRWSTLQPLSRDLASCLLLHIFIALTKALLWTSPLCRQSLCTCWTPPCAPPHVWCVPSWRTTRPKRASSFRRCLGSSCLPVSKQLHTADRKQFGPWRNVYPSSQ